MEQSNGKPESPVTPISPTSPTASAWAQNHPALNCTTTGFSEEDQKNVGLAYLPTRTPDSETFHPTLQHGATFRSIDEEAKDIHGYPKLATFVGNDLPVYRRFATTNARILLYRQAEITYLEHELSDLEQRCRSNPKIHHSVRHLMRASPGTEGYLLWQKFQQLSDAVERYNRLLLDQKRLYKLPPPDANEVNEIWNFIHEPTERSDSEPWLSPPENSMYAVDDKTREHLQQDLIKLNPRFKEFDAFTKWFTGPFLRWIYENIILRISPDKAHTGWDAPTASLERAINIIVVMIASVLPAISIIALFYIQKSIVRLIFILIFSAVFSACMSVFSNADRAGIFSASLALAGVQSVFVGSTLSNGSGN